MVLMTIVGRFVRESARGSWVGTLGATLGTTLDGLPALGAVGCAQFASQRVYSSEKKGRRKPAGRRTRSQPGQRARAGPPRIPTSLLPIVALVGRPNVGKSALFNRLVKKRVSIVHNTPFGHVTRDYQEGRAMLGDVEFLAVDTSGLEPVMMGDARRVVDGNVPYASSPMSRVGTVGSTRSSINMRATALTAGILRQSDVVLFLLDGKEGVTAVDMDLGRWFRKMSSRLSEGGASLVSKIVPVVNKCEGRVRADFDRSDEVGRMGFGDGTYVGVSAETGEGMADLYQVLQERLDGVLQDRALHVQRLGQEVQSTKREDTVAFKYPKVAIMGLTNVGKSTLLNRLVGHDRCITGPEPGLTRDAITVELKDDQGDTIMEVVDTAGWIRKTRLKAHDDSDGVVAEMTMREGKTVLRFVHVVLLIVDCERVLAKLEDGGVGARESVLSHAEAALAADAVGQGRAVVVGLNKVDVCGSKARDGSFLSGEVQQARAVQAIRESLKQVTPELGETVMVLPLSATDGVGVRDIVPWVQKIYDNWNRRIATAKLNAWLRELKMEKAHVGGGNSVSRIKYLSQVKSRPPTFVAFVSGRNKLDESVERFVANRLRDEFHLEGVPVRVVQRCTKK